MNASSLTVVYRAPPLCLVILSPTNLTPLLRPINLTALRVQELPPLAPRHSHPSAFQPHPVPFAASEPTIISSQFNLSAQSLPPLQPKLCIPPSAGPLKSLNN